jgi:Zn ribbon nucleic-acid-binding protein
LAKLGQVSISLNCVFDTSLVPETCLEFPFLQRPIEQRYGARIAILISSLFFMALRLTKAWATPGMVPIVFGAGIFAASPANPAYKGDIAHECVKCGFYHLSKPSWLEPEFTPADLHWLKGARIQATSDRLRCTVCGYAQREGADFFIPPSCALCFRERLNVSPLKTKPNPPQSHR